MINVLYFYYATINHDCLWWRPSIIIIGDAPETKHRSQKVQSSNIIDSTAAYQYDTMVLFTAASSGRCWTRVQVRSKRLQKHQEKAYYAYGGTGTIVFY